jgi:hypothetical protein
MDEGCARAGDLAACTSLRIHGCILGVLTRIASGFGILLATLLWASDGYPGPHVALWRYFGASLQWSQWSVFASCFIAFLIGAPEARWALAPRLRRRLSVRQQIHRR